MLDEVERFSCGSPEGKAFAILITGVVMWLVLPWSTRGWVVPIVVGVNLLNTLVFVLLRRSARTAKRRHLSGLTVSQ